MSISLSTLMKSFNLKNSLSKEELLDIFQTFDFEVVEYYLEKYQRLGFIKVKNNNGVYSIRNSENIEENIVNYINNNIDNIPYTDWITFLELEWPKQSRKIFTDLFHSKYPDDDDKMSVFYEPYPHRTKSLNPLEINDEYTANLLCNIYDKLFYIDNNGNITKNLVQYYTLDNHVLKIYLKKGVKYHDGSFLCADDVVNNLNDLFNSPRNNFYRANILSIEKLSNYVLQIVMQQSSKMILNILATDYACIYKKNGDRFIGTGPFFLGHDYISHQELYAFNDYHNGRPYIDKILNLQVPIDFYLDEKYESFLDNSTIHSVDNVYSLLLLLFNTKRKNVSNPKVRAYITSIVQNHINHLISLNSNYSPNYKGFFTDSKTYSYEIPKKKLFENHSVKIAIIKNLPSAGETIAALLETYGFNVIKIYYEYEEFVDGDISELDADITFAFHGLYNQYDYSFYEFLTTSVSSLINENDKIKQYISDIEFADLDKIHEINLKIEQLLIDQNIIVPILKKYRLITIPNEIINYKINNKGFIDYQTLIVN